MVRLCQFCQFAIERSRQFSSRITSAHEATAAVIFARTSKNDAQRGITAFLVDMHASGVQLTAKEEKLGIRATSTSDIILNDVRVPRSNVIGKIGNGFKIAMNQMQLGRIGVAAQALGIGQAALDLATEYACERKTFGYPLIEKQLVKVNARTAASNSFGTISVIIVIIDYKF